MERRIVLITGASSGIGKACAERLGLMDKFVVYGTSRHLKEYNKSFVGHFIKMDVTDEVSVNRAIAMLMNKENRLDILINNAGFGIAGAIEETTIEEAKEQFEVNYFGVLRVLREVIPIMRKQGSGYIINISSIGGLMGLPYQGQYSASKFALEGVTEALSIELKPFGIKVAIVEPGDCCTDFFNRRYKIQAAKYSLVYSIRFNQVMNVIETCERNGCKPELVAQTIERIISDPSPGLRYRVAPPTEKLAVMLKKFLPARLFETLISRYYKTA